jgi:uncharacterized membrane protein YraQ (UPF0718 family)
MTIGILAGLVALSIIVIRLRHGTEGVKDGFTQTSSMMRRIAPMMLIGLVIASMAEVALPSEVINRWLGDEAGVTGIAIGIAVGATVPAGPYVVIPLLGSLMTSGAGVGPIAAFITAWSVIPISRTLVWELPFLGAGFAVSRYLVVLPFPIVAGFLAPPAFKLFEG